MDELKLTKSRTIFLAISFLVLSLGSGLGCRAAPEQSYHYQLIKVDITVNKDSTFDVIEEQEYYLEGGFGFFYRDIELKDLDHISDIEVFDSNGAKLGKDEYQISYKANRIGVRWDFPRRTFDGELNREEISYLLWSSYGFSKFIDKSNQEKNKLKRHRTVPSAHGYYPLKMYAIRSSGIYQYYPNILTKIYPVPVGFLGLPIVTLMLKIKNGDYREELAQLTYESYIASAPLSIVLVLDINMTRPKNRDDLSGESLRKFWYYEAGSSVHNVLLEATVLELSSNFFPVQNKSLVHTT